jgi:sirohydrochlorin cobaltochelatase
LLKRFLQGRRFNYLSADEEMVMMKVSRFWFGAAVLVMAVFTSAALASGHGDARPMKKGILLVAFGSSEASAQVSFDNIDRSVKKAYPDIPVRWAYTSYIIREKLAKQGKVLDSPEVALAKMRFAPFGGGLQSHGRV